MKKSLFIVGLLLICSFVGMASASDYYIGTPQELIDFATAVNGGSTTANGYLTADIDMSGQTWTMIGSTSRPYVGIFDGQGHKISNVTITTNSVYISYGNNSSFKNTWFYQISITSSVFASMFSNYINIEQCIFENCNVKTTEQSASIIGSVVAGTSITNNTFINCVVEANCGTYQGRAVIITPTIMASGTIIHNIVYNCTAKKTGTTETHYLSYICPDSRDSSKKTVINYNVVVSSKASGTNRVVSGYRAGRIYSTNWGTYFSVPNGNYVSSDTTFPYGITSSATGGDGLTVPLGDMNYNWWQNTASYDMESSSAIWYWDSSVNLPKLQVFKPTEIVSLELTSPSECREGEVITAYTVATGYNLSYQWYQAMGERVTVEYDTSGTNNFSKTVSGNTYITVLSTDGNHYYYSPTLDAFETPKTALSGTWDTVNTVDYIQSSTAKQYINTGEYFNSATDSFSIKYQNLNSEGNNALLGAYSSGGNGIYLGHLGYYTNTFSVHLYVSGTLKGALDLYSSRASTEHVLEYNNNKYYVDGTLKATYTSSTITTTPSIYLFGRNDAGSLDVTGAFKIHYYQYSRNGELLRDFVPIYYNGQYAFYDKCLSGDVIYTNKGGGSFAGDGTSTPITYIHYTQSWSPLNGQTTANLSYSQAPVGGNFFKVIVKDVDSTSKFSPLYVLVQQGSPIITSFTLTNPSSGEYLPLGESVTGTVTATVPTGTLAYQWYSSQDYGATTENLTVVYCSNQGLYPFNQNGAITVRDDNNNYWRYNPSTDVKTALNPSGVTWADVNIVDYIQSSSTQWIDTGVNGKPSLEIETYFQYLSQTTGYPVLFGEHASSDATKSIQYYLSLGADFYDKHRQTYSFQINSDYLLILNNTGVKINDNQQSWSATTSTSQSNYSIAIFAQNMMGTVDTSSTGTNIKMMYFKIYDDGDMIRDYIPIKYGSTYGFFDQVENKIYTDANGGNFNGGGTPSPLTYSHHTSAGTWTSIPTQTSSTLSYQSPDGEYYYKVIVTANGLSNDSTRTYAPFHVITFQPITNNTIIANSDFIAWVNAYKYYNNATMYLGNDLILNSSLTIPLFSGTFNGQYYTLSNVTAPIFGNLSGTVTNLNFKNSIVTKNGNVGLLACNLLNNALVNRVNIENCYVQSTDGNAGSLVGAVLGSDDTIQYSDISQSTVVGLVSAGGITAVTQSDTDISNIEVSNCDILSPSGVAYGVSP